MFGNKAFSCSRSGRGVDSYCQPAKRGLRGLRSMKVLPMATKPKRARVTPSANDAQVEFYLADDVRIEADGKVTAVGLYPDRVMVLLVPLDAAEPSREIPYAIDGAAFLVNVGRLIGEHTVSITVGQPVTGTGDPITRTHTVLFTDPSASANMVGRFRPLLIASFGVKTVTIAVDDVVFVRTFEVRRGELPAEAPAPLVSVSVPKSATPPARKKGARPSP